MQIAYPGQATTFNNGLARFIGKGIRNVLFPPKPELAPTALPASGSNLPAPLAGMPQAGLASMLQSQAPSTMPNQPYTNPLLQGMLGSSPMGQQPGAGMRQPLMGPPAPRYMNPFMRPGMMNRGF